MNENRSRWNLHGMFFWLYIRGFVSYLTLSIKFPFGLLDFKWPQPTKLQPVKRIKAKEKNKMVLGMNSVKQRAKSDQKNYQMNKRGAPKQGQETKQESLMNNQLHKVEWNCSLNIKFNLVYAPSGQNHNDSLKHFWSSAVFNFGIIFDKIFT